MSLYTRFVKKQPYCWRTMILRTILHADHIVVLEKGKVVEEGKGEELLANNGLFSKMYNTQQSNCKWGV